MITIITGNNDDKELMITAYTGTPVRRRGRGRRGGCPGALPALPAVDETRRRRTLQNRRQQDLRRFEADPLDPRRRPTIGGCHDDGDDGDDGVNEYFILLLLLFFFFTAHDSSSVRDGRPSLASAAPRLDTRPPLPRFRPLLRRREGGGGAEAEEAGRRRPPRRSRHPDARALASAGGGRY